MTAFLEYPVSPSHTALLACSRKLLIVVPCQLKIDLNGKLVARFPNINDACRESNLSSASIRRAINKKGTAGGFIWMKDDDNKRPGKKMLKKVNTLNTIAVEQYSRDGKFLNRFISLSEAARQTGVDVSGISRALRVQGKSGGFFWKHEGKILES